MNLRKIHALTIRMSKGPPAMTESPIFDELTSGTDTTEATVTDPTTTPVADAPSAPDLASLAAQLEQSQLPVHSAQGLDVSNYQGHFNWGTTTGLSFGVFRLTQGLSTPGTNSPDPTAAWNHAQIAARGLHRGAYHFLDPHESGAAQAESFVAAYHALGLTATDMLWLDTEATDNPGPAATSVCGQQFMAELDKLVPHNPRGVYTFINYAVTGHTAGLEHYPLWLAYPAASAPQAPPPWAHWTFWQWGARNGADADAFNGTAADLDAWIASYAQPRFRPAPHGRHQVDGTMSMAALAAWCKTSVPRIWWLTARNLPDSWGFLERAYLAQGDWHALMPDKMIVWLP